MHLPQNRYVSKVGYHLCGENDHFSEKDNDQALTITTEEFLLRDFSLNAILLIEMLNNLCCLSLLAKIIQPSNDENILFNWPFFQYVMT